MDVYTPNPPPPANDANNNNINYFPIDDLLDFSNDDLYSSSATTTTTTTAANSPSSSAATLRHLPLSHQPSSILHHFPSSAAFNPSTDFSYHISVPNDDAAELEWLSQFVDDSVSYYPSNSFITDTINVQSSSTTKARSKRSRGPAPSISVAADTVGSAAARLKPAKKEVPASPTSEGGVRRCMHCASEKTPQWRTGPLGPKTLCNACGVRYKSGRLVPEYRPAASPTFVLTQHSNSHRKVLELRRQKELLRQQQQETFYHHRQQQQQQQQHQHNFGVC